MDILKLKQHLDATSVVQKITKSKRRKQKKSSEINADEYLDTAVLKSLDNNGSEDYDEEEEERFSYGNKSNKKKLVILKEPPKNNKRKM